MNDLIRGTRAPWYATPVVAVAVLLGFNGLTTMIVWGPWLGTTIMLMVVVTVAVSITRMVSRSRLLPTVVGAVIAVLVSIPAFARGPEGQVRYFPTPSGLHDLASAVREGIHVAATTVAPAEINRPLLALVMGGAFAIFLVAEHLAVSWRAAAVSGLVLIVPWMPAITLQNRVSIGMLLAAIACWVILLALTKRPTGAAARPSTVGAVTAAAATVVLVALVAPSALGGNGWGIIPRFTTPNGLDTSTRLNPTSDLRNSLTANSSSPVLVYVSTGARPDVFRLYTVTNFDGTQWSLDKSDGGHVPITSVLWSNPVPDWNAHQLDRVDVSIRGLISDHLPLPTVPRTVDVPGSWTYSPSQDTVSSSTDKTTGLDYSFSADLNYFNADTLRALGNASSDDALLGAKYVNIPADTDSKRFLALATEITAKATTRYDQALALQEYFRDPANFTYSTSVDPSGSDSVSVFLDKREGYCIHFATGMIMLARSLGIPARLAVGFLPGEASTDSAYVVRGGDAHAWPELYFAGEGWVRFEPTPAVQTGPRPSYADPVGNPTGTGSGGITIPTAAPSGAHRPADPGGNSPSSVDAPATGSVPWPLIVILVVLAAIALGGVSWWLKRRHSGEWQETTPETVWSTVREGLPPDTAWPLSLTPSEAVDYVTRALATEGAFLPLDILKKFTTMSNAVADYRYAPTGTALDVETITEWAEDIVAAAAQARGLDAKGRPVRGAAQADVRHGA
ncbi:transglutaminaseTgpA domain-containing protein [Demequina lutea]|uniref:Transglutaminase-like putative cysteine protease n=1 Tax=Demequina lutea TaxID=431489 RepID=A0A7Z0CHS3_9MICO|nr:transglutaminaseTgpA domain-containing protein [Demequina lutea]NYI41776.1 transglutaminase-like putative cysteine protease [Demequina lutea]